MFNAFCRSAWPHQREECVTETALSGNEAAVGVSRRGGSSFSLHEKLFTAVTVSDSGVSFIITGN